MFKKLIKLFRDIRYGNEYFCVKCGNNKLYAVCYLDGRIERMYLRGVVLDVGIDGYNKGDMADVCITIKAER